MSIKNIKRLVLLLAFSVFYFSCNETKKESNQSGLIATFGDQPSIAKGIDNHIAVVFGEKDSIYFSESKNGGQSFSETVLVGTLKGLMLGYSSGPGIVITNTDVLVTAPDRSGNLHAWSKPIKETTWQGPFRINDLDGSVGESLSSITSTPNGRLLCTWIDTRFLEKTNVIKHEAPNKSNDSKHSIAKPEVDLNKMTPTGITYKELYNKIGNVPENAKLAFHDDNNGNLFWVFLDENGDALKAENYEEFKKFRKRNGERVKIEAKIYITSSEDAGKSWTKSELVYRSPDGSVCECCKPSILSDTNGDTYLMFRNNINGSRDLHLTVSSDEGKTFSNPEKMGTGTWKIDGCPMDGGGITINESYGFNSVWQREGEIFMANNSNEETHIGYGRSPSTSSYGSKTEIVYTSGADIMRTDSSLSIPTKIGTGSFPKVVALENSSIFIWISDQGIQYKRM